VSTNGAGHAIVVVGASAGGVEALRRLVAGLPADLPATVVIVLHVPRNATSVLPDILNRAGKLPVAHARDGERMKRGMVYVAPPGFHLLVKQRTLRLSAGPEENSHRPSIDALFRSAATAHGARTIGVVLSGALDDGTAGLLAISRAGGMALVQDPDDALYPAMPSSALAAVPVDAVGDMETLTRTLVAAVQQLPGDDASTEHPIDILERVMNPAPDRQPEGPPSRFTCPACGGGLWHRDDGAPPYRCRVGHAFNEDTLVAEQDRVLEEALWTAARVLEERTELTRRLRDDARDNGRVHAERIFDDQLQEIERSRRLVRVALNAELGDPPVDLDDALGGAELAPGSAAEHGG
jgi:two-component system chemotaxis response regulator CheB